MVAALALANASAGSAAGPLIPVPSGAEVWWLDMIDDAPGVAGLTYRYRFVMPELAKLVPATTGLATEELTEEDMAELDALGSEVALPPAGDAEAELIDPADLDLGEVFVVPGTEAAADQAPALPADPDILLQDPVHADIVWLCENWVLPRLAAPAPLPAQIVISLSDRPVVFGAIDPEAVQLFEAFSPSEDRKTCIWEPW